MENVKIRRLVCVLLALTTLILGSCGFGRKSSAADLKTYTSEELGLYRATAPDGSSRIVNGEGKIQGGYILDADGNIRSGENICIKTADVREYRYVSAILSVMDNSQAEATLPRQVKPGTVNEMENGEAMIEYRVYVNPADATNPKLKATSSDRSRAEVLGSDGTAAGEAELTPVEGIATLYIRCKAPGTVSIDIRAADGGEAAYMFQLTVKEDAKAPVEAAAEDIVQSTESTQGWVIGQNVRFRERPDSEAPIINFYSTGKEITILGTDSSGWTKCEVDSRTGYIKGEYVTRSKPAETTQTGTTAATPAVTAYPAATPVPTATMPVANNDGKDHGMAYGAETEQTNNAKTLAGEAENHTHYYVKYKTVKPTADEDGYVIYRCECGASFRGAYTGGFEEGE